MSTRGGPEWISGYCRSFQLDESVRQQQTMHWTLRVYYSHLANDRSSRT